MFQLELIVIDLSNSLSKNAIFYSLIIQYFSFSVSLLVLLAPGTVDWHTQITCRSKRWKIVVGGSRADRMLSDNTLHPRLA